MPTVDKFKRMGEELLRYGGNSSQTATTMQEMQDYMVLQANTLMNLVECLLWQPEQSYTKGAVVYSPNMPAGYVAEAQSDAGQTGANEPGWDVNYDEYTDGTVMWTLKKAGGGNVQTVNSVAPDSSGNVVIDTGANKDLSNLTDAGKDRFYTDDCTIIYPNGGTEENPANITMNSRYVMDNPFPDYRVEAKAELLYNGVWSTVSNNTCVIGSGNNNPVGLTVNHDITDNIIVIQTGGAGLVQIPAYTGSPFAGSVLATTMPCRLRVWKVGKIA